MKEWLAADPRNQEYFLQLQKVWDTSRQLASQSAADENKAWERFRQRIQEPGQPVIRMKPQGFRWGRIAATVTLVAVVSLLTYLLTRSSGNPPQELIVQTQQNVLSDTLPDGSVVTLNKRSSVSYPEKFTGKTRGIALKGEAFFNVTPDKNKPFVISVNDVQVTVVGTSFNVKSEGTTTEVVVETGIVKVTRAGKTIELKAGEKTAITGTDSVMGKQEVTDRLYNYYRTHEFVCDGTPLWKLVDVLNEAYHADIVIGRPALRDLPLNTTFYNESLDQVLQVISLTFNITVTRSGNQIILQ